MWQSGLWRLSPLPGCRVRLHKRPSITAANYSPHDPTIHRQTLFLAGGRLPKLLLFLVGPKQILSEL